MVLLATTRYKLPLARLTTVPPIVTAGPPAVSVLSPTTIGEFGAIVIGTSPAPMVIVEEGIVGRPEVSVELPMVSVEDGFAVDALLLVVVVGACPGADVVVIVVVSLIEGLVMGLSGTLVTLTSIIEVNVSTESIPDVVV